MRWVYLMMFMTACPRNSVVSANANISLAQELDFGRIALGMAFPSEVEVKNGGRADSTPLAIFVEGPFAASASSLIVPGGSSARLTVTFTPTELGTAAGMLRVGAAVMALHGEGVPACVVAQACTSSTFDLTSRTCVVRQADEGTACSVPCLEGPGLCRGGLCVGAVFTACVDGDACTLDACTSEGSCLHPAVDCPVTDPCQATYCEPSSGCASVAVTDGAPCGPSTCEEAFICLAGRCEQRPRPNAAFDCRSTSLSASNGHTCAITVGGGLRCWGSNDVDQQARGYPSLLAPPGVSPGLTGLRAAAALGSTTWLARATGGVIQSNATRALPMNVSTVVASRTDEVCGLEGSTVRCVGTADGGMVTSVSTDVSSLSMGRWELCVVHTDGGVACGPSGALTPRSLPGPASAVSTSSTGLGCALVNGGAYCWGAVAGGGARFLWDAGVQALATNDALGPSVCVVTDGGVECLGTQSVETAPLPSRAVQLVLGAIHGCVLLEDHRVACWGNNQGGELGDRSFQPPGLQELPLRASWLGRLDDQLFVQTLEGVQAFDTLSITFDPDAGIQWGRPTPRVVPHTVEALGRGCPCPLGSARCAGFGASLPAETTACAQRTDTLCFAVGGAVECVDRDGGSADTWDAGGPVAQLVSARLDDRLCAVRDDGTVRCLAALSAAEPDPELFTDVKQLCFSSTEPSGCALLRTGVLRCWGPWVQSPSTVLTPSGAWPAVGQLACGAAHFCALSGSNIVQCWGGNVSGQLGRDGPFSVQAVAVPIPEQVTQISAARSSTCVLLRSGRVKCWGSNSFGELGQRVLFSSRRPRLVTE